VAGHDRPFQEHALSFGICQLFRPTAAQSERRLSADRGCRARSTGTACHLLAARGLTPQRFSAAAGVERCAVSVMAGRTASARGGWCVAWPAKLQRAADQGRSGVLMTPRSLTAPHHCRCDRSTCIDEVDCASVGSEDGQAASLDAYPDVRARAGLSSLSCARRWHWTVRYLRPLVTRAQRRHCRADAPAPRRHVGRPASHAPLGSHRPRRQAARAPAARACGQSRHRNRAATRIRIAVMHSPIARRKRNVLTLSGS
jgi:hypothetical protein